MSTIPSRPDGEPGRADHDVLPACLERLVRAFGGDQQRAHDRRQLDRDPQHAEVGDDRRGQQRQSEQRRAAASTTAEAGCGRSPGAGIRPSTAATTAYTNATAIRNTPLRPSRKNAAAERVPPAPDVVGEHRDQRGGERRRRSHGREPAADRDGRPSTSVAAAAAQRQREHDKQPDRHQPRSTAMSSMLVPFARAAISRANTP